LFRSHRALTTVSASTQELARCSSSVSNRSWLAGIGSAESATSSGPSTRNNKGQPLPLLVDLTLIETCSGCYTALRTLAAAAGKYNDSSLVQARCSGKRKYTHDHIRGGRRCHHRNVRNRPGAATPPASPSCPRPPPPAPPPATCPLRPLDRRRAGTSERTAPSETTA